MTDAIDNRITVRFAPSPTGLVHIGNMRTAFFNWLFAKSHNGEFVLRFDDTDVARSKVEYAEQIEKDLRWLGISPDRIAYQSKRFSSYDEAAEKLKKAGLLYACYETADELDRKRKILLSRRLPPIYGREGLKLSDEEHAAYEKEGRTPHWRFLLPNFENSPYETRRTEVHWDDVVRGKQTVDLASMSDPVLIRGDGTYLYTLPSVVDDIEMGITHIIRGDDHVTNTGAQIAVFQALEAEAPEFGHHNLLTTASGEGLSKRSGSLSISSLFDGGFEPMSIASLAVLIGTSDSVEAIANMQTLMDRFDPAKASKSAAKFDESELTALNKTLVHDLSFEAVKDRLVEYGIEGALAESFWNLVRGNLDFVKDASRWWQIITNAREDEALDDGDLEFVRSAFDLFPEGDIDTTTWKAWTSAVKAATGRKGKGLFMPLRIALTGVRFGPEISDLLPLLGREKILDRRP